MKRYDIVEIADGPIMVEATEGAWVRYKSTLNTRVLAAEAEVQALRVAHEAALAEAVAKERAWWLEHTDAVHSKISEMLRSARGAAHD